MRPRSSCSAACRRVRSRCGFSLAHRSGRLAALTAISKNSGRWLLNAWISVSRNEAKGARSPRGPAGVVRMIDAIHDRYLGEIEWAHSVEASHVHAIQVRVGPALKMGAD